MVLFPSTAVTASGTGSNLAATDLMWCEFLLNVTSAAAAAGDTLDVYIQASCDNGTTWDDFIHFTQVLGNGGAKKELFRWQGMIAPTTANAAPADAALAVGIKQGPHGSVWRVKYVVVDGGAHGQAFTFSVTGSGHTKQIAQDNV